MKSFWGRGDRIERELRAQRPEPRSDFLHTLESRISGEIRRRPARSLRVALAGSLTVGMLVALGATGGFSYAATGVDHAVKAAAHVVAPAHKARPAHKAAPSRTAAPATQDQPLTSAQAQYLVALCFHRHTIYVDSHAQRVLERLGATLGPCRGGRRTPPQSTKLVCIKGYNIRVTAKDKTALVRAKEAQPGFCKG